MPIYLDYAATTPVHPEVYEAMKPYWMEEFGNPASRTHIYGQRASEVVENARKQVAAVLDAKPNEIIFTSGATESNNLAILGLAKHPENKDKKHIITSPIEHKSVLEPLEYLATQGYEIEFVPMDHTGRVKAEDVVSRIRYDTLLVSIMHVNNETGVIQPIDEICEALIDHSVYVHTDAAQGFGKDLKPLKNQRLDLISISGHKIFGPKGIGALMRKRRNDGWVQLAPLMYGGGQEKGLRPGTLPTPLIVGLGQAAQLTSLNTRDNFTRSNRLLSKETIFLREDVSVNGSPEHNIGFILSLLVHGLDSEAIIMRTKSSLSLTNGSACNSNKYEASHVLEAMGLSEEEISSSIRVSFSLFSKEINPEAIINELTKVF